jgi:hypothetical protein
MPSTGSGSVTNYTWVTLNSSSYICSNKGVTLVSGAGLNASLTCAQAEYPSGGSPTTQAITCPTGTVITCLVYGTYGKAGGSCLAGDFKEDPSGAWDYLPEAVASQMIGQNSFTLDVSTDNYINGVQITNSLVTSNVGKKLKVLALCGAASAKKRKTRQIDTTLTPPGLPPTKPGLPPTPNSNLPIPSTGSGSVTNYTWVTLNSNTYTCSNKGVTLVSGAGLNDSLTCGQAEYPAGGSPTTQAITCPTGTVITCLIYGTYGRAGGSCLEGNFRDDPSGAWDYLPEAVASKMIGQNSFILDVSTDNYINGVQITNTLVISNPVKKLKVLALCGAPAAVEVATVETAAATTTAKKRNFLK